MLAALPFNVKPLAVTVMGWPLVDSKAPLGFVLALGVANVPVPLPWFSETLLASCDSRPLTDEPVPPAWLKVGVVKVKVAAVVPS